MSARKPPGLGWESWIDRQVREATERGEFDDLPGTGQPLPDLDKPFDELRWVKDKLRREGLTYMSPSVALRKEVHDAYEAAMDARSEAEARHIIAAVNEKIRAANRTGIAGPSLMLVPYDVDRVIRQRRSRGSDRDQGEPIPSGRHGVAPVRPGRRARAHAVRGDRPQR